MKPDKKVQWQQSGLYICTIGFLAACLLIVPQWLPMLWSNLGYIQRDKALWKVDPQSLVVYRQELSQAIRLFERSRQFDRCNPLGFLPQSVTVCTEIGQWSEQIVSTVGGKQYLAFFAPQELSGVRYGQKFSLLLSGDKFANLDSITLVTSTGNSTRINQGTLVAYAIVITKKRDAYLLPLRAGVETAEWAYDFPDVPPQHLKPGISYTLPHGGNGYPLIVDFRQPETLKAITVLFVDPQSWHVSPGLTVWAIIAGHVTGQLELDRQP